MRKLKFAFTKEMAELLIRYRKQADLTQTDITQRIGLSTKSGNRYISRLEQGKIKNPSLGIILSYLRNCGVRYSGFFDEIARRELNAEHDKNMSGAMMKTGMEFSQDFTLQTYRKADRECMKYEIYIKHPRNKSKSLSTASFQKAGINFAKHRIKNEYIETKVHRKLNELVVGEIWFLAYKLYSRECYRALRKYYEKIEQNTNVDEIKKILSENLGALNLALDKITEKWIKKGCKKEFLQQVREVTIKGFKELVNRQS